MSVIQMGIYLSFQTGHDMHCFKRDIISFQKGHIPASVNLLNKLYFHLDIQ